MRNNQMSDTPGRLVLAVTVLFLFSILSTGQISSADNQISSGSDNGYLFLGPREEISSKKIGKGQTITAFLCDGVAVSENPDSPWYRATLFAHGSIITDPEGKVLKEVIICETTDPQGDLSWSVLWYPEGANNPGSFTLIQGTGRWSGIHGSGSSEKHLADRSDTHRMPMYTMEWAIDPVNAPFSDSIQEKDNYQYMDKCLSFHGPHIFIRSRDLTNGISLEFSSQSGVLMSLLSADTFSPRNGATCFDRGNTVKLNGKTQGDIMLLEDTDADGDVVWLYHIWWYNKGPGIYRFIGGTGKWDGISGEGVTRGMLKARTDDHFMLKSELHWNLPE